MTAIHEGAATDIGRLRELNEDAVLASAPVFAVADGMGGHAAGEVAAAIALRSLGELFGRSEIHQDDLVAAIEAANHAILQWAAGRVEAAGMGTTLSGVCLGTVAGLPHWFVFNIGDSRVYRFVDEILTQVTTDHSEVFELILAGRITREEARHHPRRNVVTRSLGTDPPPVPDVYALPVVEGELFLVCSDGLTGEVTDSEIEAVLRHLTGPQQQAEELVRRAVDAGGRDNVSAVVVQVAELNSTGADIATSPRARLTKPMP